MCIAHYVAKAVAEEEKEGNPDLTNYTHKAQTNKHKMSRCSASRTGTVGCMYVYMYMYLICQIVLWQHSEKGYIPQVYDAIHCARLPLWTKYPHHNTQISSPVHKAIL